MKLNMEHVVENGLFWQEIQDLAREAFPPEEYLAPKELVRMAREENFDFWLLTDEKKFVGFMAVQLYEKLAYLFFLAIAPHCRNRGYGAQALHGLKEKYPDSQQVVDFEMLDDGAENRLQREKRRQFYLRNGYRETGLFLSYLGVDYEVFCGGEDFDPEMFKAMMGTLRIEGFSPRYFTK